MKKTPYQRIVDAANRGQGCRLSAEECSHLSMDTAIAERAAMDAEGLCDAAWHDSPTYARRTDRCPVCGAEE